MVAAARRAQNKKISSAPAFLVLSVTGLTALMALTALIALIALIGQDSLAVLWQAVAP